MENKSDNKNALQLLDEDLSVINTHFLIVKEFGMAIKNNETWFNKNFPYFIFSFTAHIHSVIMGMRKFFDRDDRNHSLYSIVESINDPIKKLEYRKKICNLRVEFDFYEDFANKIIAHFDKQKSKNSATIPSLDFLDENKLPETIKNLINFVKEIKLYSGDKNYIVSDYTDAVSIFNNIIECLKECLNNTNEKLNTD